MNSSRAKAITTRTIRLSKAFLSEYGRNPTISELNDLYVAEMAHIGNKANRNTPRGFAKIDPDKALEIRRMGGKVQGPRNKK